ncbi:MAG: sigma 54-interacting transcriptional regulator [Candidatus Eiseniibacteriota bacterium]
MTYRLQSPSLGDRYRRASMHFRRGMYALARQELEGLLATGALQEPDEEAEVRWRLASCCAALGFTDEADRIVDEISERPNLSPRMVSRLESVRGYSAYSRGDYVRGEEVCRTAAESLRGLGDPEGLTSALRWLAMIQLRLGRLEEAFENAYCALAEARHAGLQSEVGHAHGVLSVACIQRGQYEAAMAHGKQALDIATLLGHQSGITRHNLHLSIAARLSGQLDLAANHAMRALASAEESGATNLAVSARLAASRALREAGRLDAARELAVGAWAAAESGERERDRVLVLEDVGDLEFAAGNVRGALEKYRAALHRAEGIAAEGDLVAELAWRIGFALLETGKLDEAGSWIDRSVLVAERAGERKERALALRARGLLHALRGREAEARSDLGESLSVLETLAVPYEQGWTCLAVDRALAECGSDSDSIRSERRQHLAAARRIFDRMGALGGLGAVRAAEARLDADRRGPSGRADSGGRRAVRVLTTDWPSPAFRATLEECRKLGPTSLPLLLVGQTGTGKTILAEAIHELGRGDQGEFYPVNCAALPEHLQESELFGHRKGAFTGAEREHAGIFREAGRGTVFLDEIDKTSLEFQAKLLHVLDAREIRPVGSTRPIAVDARIICATNRDLFHRVEEGKFLPDLHHRLMCGIIEVPALRNRVEDLRTLARALLTEICALEGAALPEISEDGWALLIGHAWPGNVRELRSLLHRAVALNRGAVELDATTILGSAPVGSTLRALNRAETESGLAGRMENVEREEIQRALEQAGGVRRRAAEILGVSYRGLGKKIARLGLGTERSSSNGRDVPTD